MTKEKKTKKTKEAGYVPFTRDDIDQQDGRNSKAEELFLQMLDIPKRVVKKKKKGKEHQIVEDDFYPTSMDEVQRMEEMMVQVEAAIDDPRDTEFIENVAYMKDVLAWSKKRHWNFAWWIVICVAIVSVYYFYQAGNKGDDYAAIENWTTETMNEKYNFMITELQEGVTYQEKQLAAATTQEDIKYRTEALENQKKLVEERKAMTPEEYRDVLLEPKGDDQNSSIWSGIWCLIWLVLYIIAERPYGYMLSKRRTEMKIYSGLRGALFGVAGALVGVAGALQITEYITTYSDGSKSRDSDAWLILALKLGFLAAAVLLVLVVARIVIVIATIMGFIRNYDLIALAKQTFNKGKELTAKKEEA